MNDTPESLGDDADMYMNDANKENAEGAWLTQSLYIRTMAWDRDIRELRVTVAETRSFQELVPSVTRYSNFGTPQHVQSRERRETKSF